MKISVRTEIFKEGDLYVALSPELNVSSFGETIEDAKKSIREAIEIFVEECRELGTLEEVLEETEQEAAEHEVELSAIEDVSVDFLSEEELNYYLSLKDS